MTLNNPASGHATGLPAVTRRALLWATPALAAAPYPLQATTVSPDPLPGLFALSEQLREEWLAIGQIHGEDSPEDKAAWEAFRATEDQIEATVATSPEGVAAQIRYMIESYGPGLVEPPERPVVSDVPVAFLNLILEGLGRIA